MVSLNDHVNVCVCFEGMDMHKLCVCVCVFPLAQLMSGQF